jgi:hypothetical protein
MLATVPAATAGRGAVPGGSGYHRGLRKQLSPVTSPSRRARTGSRLQNMGSTITRPTVIKAFQERRKAGECAYAPSAWVAKDPLVTLCRCDGSRDGGDER